MKRWLAAICAAVLFGMLWRVPAVCAAEEPEIPAAAYALMETETGTLLLESHSGDRLACGAMAKLMTAYLAAEQVEQGNWTADTVLTATDAVTGTKGAVIWLTAGEEMTVGDLLKGLIVGNANDAAVVLAVAAGGDAETFVMDMNARAFGQPGRRGVYHGGRSGTALLRSGETGLSPGIFPHLAGLSPGRRHRTGEREYLCPDG